MSESRQINFRVNLDTSQVPKQTEQTTKQIRSELEKQKANIEKIMNDLVSSGGKLKVPIDQFKTAIAATGNALDSMGEKNAQALEKLYPKYDQLKAKIQQAWEEGRHVGDMQVAMWQNQERTLKMEIQSREKLNQVILKQWSSLDELDRKVQEQAAAAQKDAQATQTLNQQLNDTKKKMQELVQANKQGTQEYQNLAAKAKELSTAIQKLNSDSKPDAQVKLRTELMNAKQAMAEAEKEFGRGSIQFQQARDKAIQLQQAMNSMNKQVKLMSAPNATFQGIVTGLSGISGAASAAMGTMALFGSENENTQKILSKLNAVMSITMGLQSMSMILNKNSAVQLNIVGKLTDWWARCKAKAAGATTAETTAVATNTAVHRTQTSAVAASTAANNANAVSWKAIGIAIKSIPFIGWVAIIGTVIAAIVNLTKSTYSAAKAKKELYKATLESNKSAADELTQIRVLYTATQDVTKSIESRRAAAMKMQGLYPSVFSNLKTEAILAGEAAEAYDQLSASILKKARAEARQERLKNLEKEILDANTNYEKEAQYWLEKKWSIQFSNPKYKNDPEWALAEWNLKVLEKKYLDPIKDMEKEQKKLVQDIVDMTETPLDDLEKATEGSVANLKAKMDEAERIANSTIKSIDPNGNVTYYTDAETKQARRDYYKYKKQYDAKRFNPKAKTKDHTSDLGATDIADQKETDLIIKAQRERAKAILKMEQELEQARINKMDEGLEKRIRQRKLNDQKEIDAIYSGLQNEIEAEVNRQKAIWDAQQDAAAKAAKAKGKQYRKVAFDSGEILTTDFNPGESTSEVYGGSVDKTKIDAILKQYGLLEAISIEAQQKRIENEQKAQRLAMQEYLKDYGTMEEKKTAIAALYAEKRAQATSDAERIRLTREENQAYADLGFDDFVRNKAALAFGEIDNLSQKTIGDLILQLETYRDKALETFDPDKIEKYEQALAKLKRAQALNSGGILGQMFTPDFIKEQQSALQELKAAEQTHNDMLAKKAEKEQEVANKVQAIIDKVKELTGTELTADQVKDGATVGAEIDKLMLQGNAEGARDLSDAMQNLDNARGELGAIEEASQRATNSFNQFKEAFTAKFTGANGALAGAMSIMNEIAALAQGAKEIFDDIAGTAELLGADMGEGSSWDTASQVMNAFAESAEGGKKIVESLISLNPVGILTGVTQIFTSWINAFATIHDNAREKKIKTLQKEIDELQRINKRIEHRLEKEYSKEASRDYQAEIKNLEKQRQLIQQQIRAEQDKKNTDNDRIQEWKDQLEELSWQIEEYKDKAKDAIIGEDIASSINNFVDALSDAWGKTGDRAKATKDYVKTMLRQMVQEAMKTDLSAPIEELRKKMAEALNDDVVTKKEQEELEKFAEEIAQTIEKKYGWADKIIGDSNYEQNATAGGFQTMSQDTGTELVGRATAIQICGEMRRELLMNIWIDMAAIKAAAERGQQVNDEIRGLQLLAVGYLEDIAKNTRELYQMNERLEKIEKNTRNI